jgi:hypothetical protein
MDLAVARLNDKSPVQFCTRLLQGGAPRLLAPSYRPSPPTRQLSATQWAYSRSRIKSDSDLSFNAQLLDGRSFAGNVADRQQLCWPIAETEQKAFATCER